MRWSSFVVGVIATAATACAGSRVTRRPPTDASEIGRRTKAIAAGGGSLELDGARLVIPAGALKSESTYSIARLTGADLAGFPQGTAVGFEFQPAGKQFRIPASIELPSDGAWAEAICLGVSGERTTVAAYEVEKNQYRFHVNELPARCAIYTEEHTVAAMAARARHGEVVARQNETHKWAVRGQLCNPKAFLRTNALKSIEEPPGIGGCPLGMAPIPGGKVCIDRWEAHVVEVLDDRTFLSWSPYFNPGDVKIRARSAPGAVPQGYISQVQAARACGEAGKRLCKDSEWVSACRGANNTQYPYGNTHQPGACNDHRDRHPAVEYLQSNDVYAKLEHPCINQMPDSVFLTGAKTECRTPEDVFDMVGNLHEWTADRNGTFRGGYYVEATLNGRGCDYVTTAHDAVYWDYSTGFRCCADRQPDRDGSGIRISPE